MSATSWLSRMQKSTGGTEVRAPTSTQKRMCRPSASKPWACLALGEAREKAEAAAHVLRIQIAVALLQSVITAPTHAGRPLAQVIKIALRILLFRPALLLMGTNIVISSRALSLKVNVVTPRPQQHAWDIHKIIQHQHARQIHHHAPPVFLSCARIVQPCLRAQRRTRTQRVS